MIDTREPFRVRTEFISRNDTTELYMIRTRLTQGFNEMLLETDCEDYLSSMSAVLQGQTGVVLSAWDNRDGRELDLSLSETCEQPASTCDGAVNAISDVKVYTSGYNEE
jgi:hypothetical protein